MRSDEIGRLVEEQSVRCAGTVWTNEARAWVSDVLDVLGARGCPVVTCVYCGKAYPSGSPTHGAEILTEHIRVCEKHPMRALETALRGLADALPNIEHRVGGRCYFPGLCGRREHLAFCDKLRDAHAAALAALAKEEAR